MKQSFESFMEQRLAASTAFVLGDAELLREISVTADPASIYGPNGTVVSGAGAVNEANEQGAQAFTDGGENRFEILHMAADDQLAYWTGIQHSKVKIKASDELVPMDLRVTELFRLENGEWKLFHRHADMLKA
ncbi:MAG TPA: nuclear transport factor 2 family protein [Candidatus Saccharimonadales bacterium]|nr:nuclear transport factor 2 family protein [Candidatus Saccharimonadales bacterium]